MTKVLAKEVKWKDKNKMLLGRSKLLHHSVWSTGKLGHPCSLVTELNCSRQLWSVLVWQFTPSYRNAFFIYGTKIHEKRIMWDCHLPNEKKYTQTILVCSHASPAIKGIAKNTTLSKGFQILIVKPWLGTCTSIIKK